jgi:hypothetical protein
VICLIRRYRDKKVPSKLSLAVLRRFNHAPNYQAMVLWM